MTSSLPTQLPSSNTTKHNLHILIRATWFLLPHQLRPKLHHSFNIISAILLLRIALSIQFPPNLLQIILKFLQLGNRVVEEAV
jgi:membrane glycosyltransferase